MELQRYTATRKVNRGETVAAAAIWRSHPTSKTCDIIPGTTAQHTTPKTAQRRALPTHPAIRRRGWLLAADSRGERATSAQTAIANGGPSRHAETRYGSTSRTSEGTRRRGEGNSRRAARAASQTTSASPTTAIQWVIRIAALASCAARRPTAFPGMTDRTTSPAGARRGSTRKIFGHRRTTAHDLTILRRLDRHTTDSRRTHDGLTYTRNAWHRVSPIATRCRTRV